MQNFSPLGNFINNFLQQQFKPAVNILPGSTILTSTAGEAGTPINNPTTPQPMVQQQTLLQQQQLATMEMSSAERAVLVKDLLKLPETLQEFVATAQAAKTGTQAAPNPLLLAENLNVEQLMRLIQQNGKEALTKLVQLNGMMSKAGNVDTKQLQELQYIINACIPNANMSNTQFLKNLILLYLPWLPVGENNNFDIDFSSSGDEESGGESDDTITILIQTENYGNVKVLLILEAANKISIEVNCAKSFPKDLLLLRLNEDSKEYKLETNIAVNEHEIVEKTEENKERKVHMSGAAVLNPYVLLMSHSIIRKVIEIDKSQTLVDKRKADSQDK